MSTSVSMTRVMKACMKWIVMIVAARSVTLIGLEKAHPPPPLSPPDLEMP